MQLQIELEQRGDQLQLRVINTGRLGEPTLAASRCVGYVLDSLRQRLKLHFGYRAELALHQNDTHVSVTVRLPLR